MRALAVTTTIVAVLLVLFAVPWWTLVMSGTQWSVIGTIARFVLAFVGVEDPVRSRSVATAVVLVTAALLIWGNREAMRVPRIKYVDVTLPRLGPGLDGTRVVAVTDTHFGPINRTRCHHPRSWVEDVRSFSRIYGTRSSAGG